MNIHATENTECIHRHTHTRTHTHIYSTIANELYSENLFIILTWGFKIYFTIFKSHNKIDFWFSLQKLKLPKLQCGWTIIPWLLTLALILSSCNREQQNITRSGERTPNSLLRRHRSDSVKINEVSCIYFPFLIFSPFNTLSLIPKFIWLPSFSQLGVSPWPIYSPHKFTTAPHYL